MSTIDKVTKMRTLAKVKLALLLASVVFWLLYGYYFPQLYAYAKGTYIGGVIVAAIIVFISLDSVIITDYLLGFTS